MIACICGGIGEYCIVVGIISAISCISCWLKKKFNKHSDCKCNCHNEKDKQ